MALEEYPTSLEELRSLWCDEIDQNANTVDKGRDFAIRISSQYLDVDPDDENFHWTDGPNDGGIDVAYLDLGQDETSDGPQPEGVLVGTTWFAFQCKYSSSPGPTFKVFEEGRKFLSTVSDRSRRSRRNSEVIDKLGDFFRESGGELDRLIYVLATVDPLDEGASDQLDELRDLGRSKTRDGGPDFDAVGISLKTIHQRMSGSSKEDKIELKIRGQFAQMSDAAWVGSVAVADLYQFLKDYRKETQDLDRIYEKNVRRWLGFGNSNSVNSGLRDTLLKEPGKLGVYNNGITMVANRFAPAAKGVWQLTTPYIVNGCQTTKTIYEVVDRRLGSGGTAVSEEREAFADALAVSSLVVKITTTEDDDELNNITRFSNTQNAVRPGDLVALDDKFLGWKAEVETKYTRFLEIQKGSWESRKAYERSTQRALPRFTAQQDARPILANEMIKVFGSGWMGYAGTAAIRSTDFRPNGKVFREITELAASEFGADEFIAASRLHDLARSRQFGGRFRNAPPARKSTRFLFYYAFVELARSMIAGSDISAKNKSVTNAILTLATTSHELLDSIADVAAGCLDGYFGDGEAGPFTHDPGYEETQSYTKFVQSARFDKHNLTTKAPAFQRELDVAIKAASIGTVKQPSLGAQVAQILDARSV